MTRDSHTSLQVVIGRAFAWEQHQPAAVAITIHLLVGLPSEQ